jgi:hypothetical protein
MHSAVRGALAAAVLLLVSTLVASAAPKAKALDPFATPDTLLRWLEAYRSEPAPDKLPAAVRAMSRHGLLRDPEKAGMFVGFIAGVLGQSQTKAKVFVDKLFPVPPEDQGAVILGLAYSGLPDWKERLGEIVERMPARKVLVRRVLYDKGQGLYEIALDKDPAALDTLWGYYLATGLYEPVVRVVAALAWTKEKTDVAKLTAAGVAKWTLATYATRERDLIELYRREMKSQPKPIAAELREIIVAAEAFETGKIRKDMVAAIEDLKRRNPTGATPSIWSKAANIGATAIAVGCIAASALGQAEIGVPCIIGGALTQGAGKLLSGGN